MRMIHYVDTDQWRVVCEVGPARDEPRRWTFVLDRVTCPECLGAISRKATAGEDPPAAVAVTGR